MVTMALFIYRTAVTEKYPKPCRRLRHELLSCNMEIMITFHACGFTMTARARVAAHRSAGANHYP